MKIHIVEKCPAGCIFDEHDFDKIKEIKILDVDSNLCGAAIINEEGTTNVNINITKKEMIFLKELIDNYFKEKIDDNTGSFR